MIWISTVRPTMDGSAGAGAVLRGRLRGGLGDRELEETNRPVEVLQPALAEFHQREGEFLLLVLDEGLRRLGDEDLAAAGGGADPG